MNQIGTVGLLTCRKHPLLPWFLDLMERMPCIEPVLLFDEKALSAKEMNIFGDRTEGAFPCRDIDPYCNRYRWATFTNHNGPECQAFVNEHNLGLLVNAGTPRMIKPDLIKAASIGILSVHPGLLPKYRGATCCEWAIYNDDPVGVTAYFMDEGLDSGPILFSRELAVRKGETYTEIRVALYRLAHEVCAEAIQAVIEQGITPTLLAPQPEAVVYKPIPDELLEVAKKKLVQGEYKHAK